MQERKVSAQETSREDSAAVRRIWLSSPDVVAGVPPSGAEAGEPPPHAAHVRPKTKRLRTTAVRDMIALHLDPRQCSRPN
jgi:hypothetical protein